MTNQPLSVEEIAQQIIGEWGYEEPYWWQPIAANLKAYAAQQCAEKDKRIAELWNMLNRYRVAQSKILSKWSDGDASVKAELWKKLHCLEDEALDCLAKHEPAKALAATDKEVYR